MNEIRPKKRKYKSYLHDVTQNVPYRTLCRNQDEISANIRTQNEPQPSTSGSHSHSDSNSDGTVPADLFLSNSEELSDVFLSRENFFIDEIILPNRPSFYNESNSEISTSEEERSYRASELSSDENANEREPTNDIDVFLSLPMYNGSSSTVGSFLTSFLKHYAKHKLTKTCFEDTLKLITDVIPKPHNLPTTKYRLFKSLENLTSYFSPVIHQYCLMCTIYLENIDDEISCTTCGSTEKGYFVSVPIKNCLKNLFENCHLYKKLIDKNEPIHISDILTSVKYKTLKSTVCPSKYDITLIVNSDGVSISKSSAQQLWPIQVSINELPPHTRANNIITCGLWIGSTKPNMNTFFRPLCEELANDSICCWKHPQTKEIINSNIAISCISVDSPARAMIQNISQFNGKCGCNFCEEEGKTVIKGSGHCRVYPLLEPPPILRTKERMFEQAKTENNDYDCCGVKGHSIINIIPYFDIAKGFIPDYMHCLLLGVTKQFLSLWFDSSNSNKDFYINPCLRRTINEELSMIKPPDVVIRIPRSIDKRSSWKASELRSWLLYYSIPIISEKIPKKYFQHWILLVKAAFIFLKESISNEEIELGEILIKEFIRGTEKLYGETECSYNVHQLCHLAESVRNWGPLWATSCFPFENNNGFLAKIIHGTHQVQAELMNSLKIINLLQVLKCKTNTTETVNMSTCNDRHTYKPLGTPTNLTLPETVKIYFVRFEGTSDSSKIKVFKRALISDEVFTSKLYSREIRHNSYTVSFKIDNIRRFGEIQYFIELVKNNFESKLYAILNTFAIKKNVFVHNETSTSIDHIINISDYQTNVVVDIRCILYKVVKLPNYVCLRPNFIERNL